MTQEKQLLLTDLCSRLPCGVKCQFEDTIRVIDGKKDPFFDYVLSARHLDLFINHKNFYIKPYLRPMSSMTEEEEKEYHNLCYEEESEYYKNGEWTTRIYFHETIESIDWLNAHHFDYRGLIEKGLALEAPEDMY